MEAGGGQLASGGNIYQFVARMTGGGRILTASASGSPRRSQACTDSLTFRDSHEIFNCGASLENAPGLDPYHSDPRDGNRSSRLPKLSSTV